MLEINSTSLWSSITNLVFSMYTCFFPLIKINHPWVLISIFVVVKSRELEPSLKFHIAKKKIPYINNAGERYWLCLIIIITSINNNVELLQMRFSLHGLAKLENGSPVESSLFYMNYCINKKKVMENSLKCHWTLKNVQTFRAKHGFVDFCPLQCPKTVMAVKNKINK